MGAQPWTWAQLGNAVAALCVLTTFQATLGTMQLAAVSPAGTNLTFNHYCKHWFLPAQNCSLMHTVIFFLSWGQESWDVTEVKSVCGCSTHSFIHAARHVQPKGATLLWCRRMCLLQHIAHSTFLLYASPCAAITFCWKSCTALLSAIPAYTKSYLLLFLKGCFQ